MRGIIDIFKEMIPLVEGDVLPELQGVNPDIKGVYFEHGHFREINMSLNQKEETSLYDQKYPLIALFEDIREQVDSNGVKEAELLIAICYNTRVDYKPKERHNNVIKPILTPVYKALMDRINTNPHFIGYSFPHTKIDRPYWGVRSVNEDSVQTIFDDILDAIEINIRIKYLENCKF